MIQTNGSGDTKSLIYSIYGKDIANGIMEVDYTFEDIVVKGVVGRKDIARSNRSNQIFFVNNRYVKDKSLSAAIDQAYKDVLPAGKYGFAILNIEIDPSKVDVNVHPAKLEVRFEEESKVFKAVYHAIKSVLEKVDASNYVKKVAMSEIVSENIQSDENKLDTIEQEENEIDTKKEKNKKEEFKPKPRIIFRIL